MNRYNIYKFKEFKQKFLNNAYLSLVLLNLKILFNKKIDFVKFKDLNNELCLRMILYKFDKFNNNCQKYLMDKVINKINKNALYLLYIMDSSSALMKKDYEYLEEVLKSFVTIGLIKDVIISNNKDKIKITLPDNTDIIYSYIPLEKDILDELNGRCHGMTEYFLHEMDLKEKVKAAVVLEDNKCFGHYYHSFVIINGNVFDYAHNIIMSYEDYLKVINPKVLICEDKDTILNSIENLKNDKSFNKSSINDILKYAIYKNRELKKTFK